MLHWLSKESSSFFFFFGVCFMKFGICGYLQVIMLYTLFEEIFICDEIAIFVTCKVCCCIGFFSSSP